jgi:hypothetical protein
MNVVRHSVDKNQHSALVPDDSGEIGMDPSGNITPDHRFAVLGREYDVGEVGMEGLGHGVAAFPASFQDAIRSWFDQHPGMNSGAVDRDAFGIGCSCCWRIIFGKSGCNDGGWTG